MTGAEIGLVSLNGRQLDEHDKRNVLWMLCNGATPDLTMHMSSGSSKRAYTIEHFTEDQKILSVRVCPEQNCGPTGYLLFLEVQWPRPDRAEFAHKKAIRISHKNECTK